MDIESLNIDFTVCKVNDLSKVNFDSDFIFVGKTDNELSVVCPTTIVRSLHIVSLKVV